MALHSPARWRWLEIRVRCTMDWPAAAKASWLLISVILSHILSLPERGQLVLELLLQANQVLYKSIIPRQNDFDLSLRRSTLSEVLSYGLCFTLFATA
jgi:hypothetical protein